MTFNSRKNWLAVLTSVVLVSCLTPLRADDRSELKQGVKWSIWHEGCRVYADNNEIGNIGQIRHCLYETQRHNQRAQDLLGNVNDTVLQQIIIEGIREIPEEFHLREAFYWVMYHEGQRESIREMLAAGRFNGIRSVYADKQGHNPNAVNLLAAVSNGYISDLINSM